jgi:site-specific DNA-methyltransferase (adenine-specific)
MEWLARVMESTIPHCETTWLSYNVIWDLAVKHWAYQYSLDHTDLKIKPFIWTYTFGQNRNNDCGPGHRPILRFRWKGSPLYPDNIKVPSWRNLHGDKRASPGGRVPLDAWTEFPRIVGNAKERRPWHPTQHPEALVERAIKLSTREEDNVLDLFSGTGTVIRVCRRIHRNTVSVELNPIYCDEIAKEHRMKLTEAGVWTV